MLTGEIPRDQWTRFFDEFSREHENWIVNWEVLNEKLGDQEKTSRLPLVGISAELKGSRPRINLMTGGRFDAHLTQIFDSPKRVMFEPSDRPGHEAIEIESEDGIVTLITFRHIDPENEERLLPPKEDL